MATDPMLDLTRTAALGDASTPEGRAALAEILQLYFDNVTSACDAMRNAGTSDAVRAHAHRAKGASGVVGALSTARVFADIEARAAAGETIPDAEYDELQRQLESLRREAASQLGADLR
jgi:hypothetical protein